MRNQNRAGRAGVLVLAASVFLVVAIVAAPGARSDPHFGGQISVNPSTGLVDGQVVGVSGSGFQKNKQLRIVECGPTSDVRPPVYAICSNYSVDVATDADGNFPAQDFTVSTTIVGTRIEGGHSVPATYDCLPVNNCHIHVFAPAQGSASANQDIFFAQ